MSAAPPGRHRPPRYRVLAYQIEGHQQRLLMDSTGTGFIAATATLANAIMSADVANEGPRELQAHLAILISRIQDDLDAEHDQRPR
jgi:hypothetical protein